ncbi:MAG: methyl-accepting chemotaxis protein [Desulfuromonadaceae bacterium]|nr:methyl-accepting chemotaxis protein [Desulfuromonadaceae bacterium]MDD2856440.1 methyl-accepting chemotaxis protein [Desulfuromonadaceae bacterium]
MTNIPYKTVAAVRSRILILSLLSSGIVGIISVLTGSGSTIFIAVILTALVCAFLSLNVLNKLLAGIRTDQNLLLDELLPTTDRSFYDTEPDKLRGIFSVHHLLADSIESAQKENRRQRDLILSAKEKLQLLITTLSTADEKDAAKVREAVNAIELLNREYSVVIAEIEELSGRTDERASISTEMSATTDAIAENINHYSNSVLETSNSIELMARATRETAENIRALSSSTEQTVASINIISASQNKVRDNSEKSAAVSENVRAQTQQGLHSMAATMKAMQEISISNEESFESINRLSRYSARVGEFLAVIQEVVEQTNLLSLNASIIAAQAGARGRAFAVVAEEVRALARRTSASTKEIEDLVRNIQKETSCVQRSVTQGKDRVKQGVKICGMANSALEAISISSEDAFKMVSSIVVETSEQAASINRITEEAEKNLERVQQITIATEHQQQSSSVIVRNLGQMRELAHRINSSAQEQAKGNRLYLKSIMEDNDRTKDLNSEAAHQIALANQAVTAIKGVEEQILAKSVESLLLVDLLKSMLDFDSCNADKEPEI